jgi:hypothetical protein
MPLSNKSIQKIAEVLAQEVIDCIQTDTRYSEFMMEVIPDVVSEKLGSHDPKLVSELSICIMDKIYLECVDG